MARIRTIKPEFWANEALSLLPEATHMLAAALLNYADDEGYFNANPELIRAACFPLREPSVSITGSLQSLQTCGYLKLGFVKDGRRYGHIVNFTLHQRVSHPSPSKIKTCDIIWDDSVNPHGILRADSALNGIEGNRREEERNISMGRIRGQRKNFVPPTADQVADYCRERKNGIDPQQFIDHYEANGWMRGKAKVVSWKACVRTWERNNNGARPCSNGDATRPLTEAELEGWNPIDGGGE